jgi:hypothetical protein
MKQFDQRRSDNDVSDALACGENVVEADGTNRRRCNGQARAF